MKRYSTLLAVIVIAAACGDDKDEKKKPPQVVSGFEFEIAIEPATFAPNAATPVRIASDGKPDANPPDTMQLYTPNDTLTWLDTPDGHVFGFDVELGNFYRKQLCDLVVVVDTITPSAEHRFLEDDRGTEYAGQITGQGVWAYGDLAAAARHTRRWKIELQSLERFVIKGRVLADAENCGRVKLPE